ncbi:unnamed protein product, partial [Adineta steineri]
YKRKQKKKKIIEQQRNFNSPSTNFNQSTAPRYASSEMLSSTPSTQFIGNKSQSQALIAPTAAASAVVYKNIEATTTNESIQNLNDIENQQQQETQSQILTDDRTTEIEATTQC